jgi:hypothetical protein
MKARSAAGIARLFHARRLPWFPRWGLSKRGGLAANCAACFGAVNGALTVQPPLASGRALP